MLRVTLSAGLLLIISTLGCASRTQQLTCAPIALRDGKQVVLTRAEYARVQPKLADHLARRGLILTPDLASADQIATIIYEPDPTQPGVGTLLVRDILPNTFSPVASARSQSGGLNIDAGNGAAINGREAAYGFPNVSNTR